MAAYAVVSPRVSVARPPSVAGFAKKVRAPSQQRKIPPASLSHACDPTTAAETAVRPKPATAP